MFRVTTCFVVDPGVEDVYLLCGLSFCQEKLPALWSLLVLRMTTCYMIILSVDDDYVMCGLS